MLGASHTEVVSWQNYIAKVARSTVPIRFRKAQKTGYNGGAHLRGYFFRYVSSRMNSYRVCIFYDCLRLCVMKTIATEPTLVLLAILFNNTLFEKQIMNSRPSSPSQARYRVFLVAVLDGGSPGVFADFLGRPRGRFGSESFAVSG